jgi:CRISPR-associated protein Csc2
MTLLKNSIKSEEYKKFFHDKLQYKPMGKYVHFLTVRVTESYALFQTDQELNKAKVRAGIKKENRVPISRLAMFKRKQSTPERLVGRELLRNYGFMTAEECEYNVRFAMNNPDCIIYGFAIGNSGSEKSKVVVDTAYSLTSFDESHETFTLNAPYENGTMTAKGEMKELPTKAKPKGILDGELGTTTSRINQQDHIRPQVFFPSIVTLKDPTEASFLYVFNNLLRTSRYGAQTTRTGTMRNEMIGVVFADGEIVSNLRWTQKIYDQFSPVALQSLDPLDEEDVVDYAKVAMQELLAEEPIVTTPFLGNKFNALMKEVTSLTSNEEALKTMLKQADDEAKIYYNLHIKSKKAAAATAESGV